MRGLFFWSKFKIRHAAGVIGSSSRSRFATLAETGCQKTKCYFDSLAKQYLKAGVNRIFLIIGFCLILTFVNGFKKLRKPFRNLYPLSLGTLLNYV